MIIERLSDYTVLVSLQKDDMERRGLDFGSEDEAGIRRALAALMRCIGDECGLERRGRSFLIEALPGGDSCLLIISSREVRRRRSYRIKREKAMDYCMFTHADDLLDYLNTDAGLACEVLRFGSGYLLLPMLPLTERRRVALSEYGHIGRLNSVSAARAREYGTKVYERQRDMIKRRSAAKGSRSLT